MAKKIEEFMLSDDLKNKINQISNLSQIHMDQLDSSLKTLLKNIGDASRGVVSYDDSELRNRVISLEKNSAVKSQAFNKSSDKLTKAMLDTEMQSIIDDMQDFSDALSTKLNKVDADNKYRVKDEKLQLTDFSEEYQQNLKNIINKVNALNTALGGLTFVGNDIENLKRIISDLPNTAITKDFGDARYRLNTDKLNTSDFNDTLRPAFQALELNYNKLNNLVSNNDLNRYRRNDDTISMSDLDNSIKAKLNTIDQLNNNINDRIATLVTQNISVGFANTLGASYAGTYNILNNSDFQTYIQSLLTGTPTNNRATYSQILFALYNAVKLLNSKTQSAEAQLSNVNSQFTTYSQSANYSNELSRNRVNEKVNTLYYLSGLPVQNLVSTDFVQLSNSGSNTILQANVISNTYSETAARAKTEYISIATNAIHDSDSIVNLEFPGVTTISATAFKNCPNLTTVSLPAVKTIADKSFVGCDNIMLIILPEAYTLTGKEGLPAMCRIVRVVGQPVA